ncbi:MAG TPA: zinc-binding dehydrogenase [Limnochordales bacterium]
MADSMQCVRFHQHGGPEVLQVEQVAVPQPPPGWVRIRVRACALNHLDLWNRRGLPGRRAVPLPRIPGADVAGEVDAVGEGVQGVERGQKVVVNPGISCGRCRMCLSGQDNLCPDYHILGSRLDGGYAQYVVVPAANLLPMPQRLDFAAAAAFPLTFLTAWHMLTRLAGVRPGETVLVWGAGSGVGTAAVQIARLLGARVFATVGSRDKLEQARSLGAEVVLNHHEQAVDEEVRRLTGRRGVDVVVEHVGQATWEKSLRSLTHGGRLVTCGATTGAEGLTDIRLVFARQLRILGSYMGSKGELWELLPFVESGALRPVVDRVLPLEQAAQAHRIMEERRFFGKLVLEIP